MEREGVNGEAVEILGTETAERAEALDPALRERVTAAWAELQTNLADNRAASVVVFREQTAETSQSERLAREIMMAGLGVKGHEVNIYPSRSAAGPYRYLERVTTDVAGVDIVYADSADGSRTISLAINHQPTDEQRTAPTDIERVIRTAQTHADWIKSVEQFGAHWNNRQPEVQQATLLAIDIDECILPAVDRRPTSLDTLQQIAERLKDLADHGMTIVLNTGRSAPETQRVLEYFQSLGITLNGAIAEGGAIRLRQADDSRDWLMERNPTVSASQWAAIQACREFIDSHYIQTHLGYGEPKISAVTFKLNTDSGTTGQQICQELRQLLMNRGLPTDAVDNADVSAGGLQLFSSGIDKAAGMRYIHQTTGTEKNQTIAIGDSKGDLPMFSESGLTAAPYNAARELSLNADYYSPFDAEYGILDIINQVIRAKNSHQP